MKRLLIFIIPILFSSTINAQIADTIVEVKHYDIEQIVITATRTPKQLQNVSGQVDIITRKDMENIPMANVDDALRAVGNVYVNRSWGIFSKNASVTMRGLSSSDRTLVLIDGVPKNKIAGGSVNWHNINPENIEQIEIVKGPASALYGNNAMGGVINIITKRPQEAFSGVVDAYGGSYNSYASNLFFNGSNISDDRGLYWSLNGNYRQGEGYIFEPMEVLSPIDVPDTNAVETYLKEYGAGMKLGYQFNKKQLLELSYDIFDELRGGGIQIYEQLGKFDAYETHQLRSRYKWEIDKTKLQAIAYYNQEYYNNQKEGINDYNDYKLSHNSTIKQDVGINVMLHTAIAKSNNVVGGVEVRRGNVIGEELYRTSTDVIEYEGALDFFSFYLQNEISLFKKKVEIIVGLRNNWAFFNNGKQRVTDPTKNTGFTEAFYEDFANTKWFAFNPKVSAQYNIKKNWNIYALVGTGFKPPKLDDLCKTGKISKGFRLANPELRPETIINYELGLKGIIHDNLSVSSAIYYSRGKDFHYLMPTGDILDTGGSSLKTVYKRENVTDIGINGAEITLNYTISKNVILNASYAYNNSVIIAYDNGEKNLAGKKMLEVSPHLFYSGLSWRHKFIKATLNCSYTDEQFADDENEIVIEDYFLVNSKVQFEIGKKINLHLACQNIFDVQFVDRKNQLSPGRFFMAGAKINFGSAG